MRGNKVYEISVLFFILRSILEIFEILAGFLSSMIPSTILHQKVPSSNIEFLFTS